VGRNCTVGHGAILHGCTVSDNSLIGMGATILTGARIGRNCIIGANALIPEGKDIPDNSLVVGAPGRIVRQLGAEAEARLLATAEIFQRNWRRFAPQIPRS
jgi:carbonic anhydrase/acetyltransferase-like protein (isoleucine patch superfamily)